MMAFWDRRIRGFVLLVMASAGFWWLDFSLSLHLRPAALVSGISLFLLVLILSLFNARKKLPFLPLLNASTWLQFHIYAGLFSVVLCAIHTGGKLPRGPLEILVGLLFLVVTGSGFLGLAITRFMPVQLTLRGENVIFDRVPAMQANLRREVEDLVIASVAATRSSSIADFYEWQLQSFFAGPRNICNHLIGNQKPIHRLLSEVRGLERYLNEEERKVLAQLETRVRMKDNLDFQLAIQGLLKGWLFVHIPLTYALLIFSSVHGLLAWWLARF